MPRFAIDLDIASEISEPAKPAINAKRKSPW